METDVGYKIGNGHFKLSSKIHIEDFIYAKRLLQNNFYASGFAFLLTKEIAKKIFAINNENSEKSDFTLIGYGYYSELLVSRVETFLKKHLNKNNIDHFIIENEANIKFENYFKKVINIEKYDTKTHYFIIIIPISTTLITPIKIENELRKQFKEYIKNKGSIDTKHFPFYSLVIVGDERNNKEKKDNKLTEVEKNFWKKIDLNNKIIITENRELGELRNNHFFVELMTKWYLPDKCSLCSPTNLSKEIPLFYTDKVSVTPLCKFGWPDIYYKKQTDAQKIFFENKNGKDEKAPLLNSEMINFGHHKGTGKHFYYYIIYDKIFRENKKQIEIWAEEIHDNLNKKRLKPHDKILLITPDKSENGLFVNFINEKVFNGRANILNVKADFENIHDFNMFFKSEILEADYIFYVDNLLATANSFFLVNDLLKLTEENERFRPFGGIFTLVNRMDKYTIQNVKRKLNTKNNENDNIYSFMDLSFPVIPIHSNETIECHLCVKVELLEKLIENSSLDSLKLFYKKRILNKIAKKNKSTVYSDKGTNRQLHRLFVSHYLLSSFSNNEEIKEKILNEKFDGFVDWFEKKFSKKYFNINDEINDKITILKVLSEPPFIEYKIIKEKVFSWTLFEIERFIVENNNKNVKPFNIDYLKILIKTLAVLKSNYLINEKFINFIVELLNKFNNINETKNGLLIKYNNIVETKNDKEKRLSENNYKAFDLFENNAEIEKLKDEINRINKIEELKLYIAAYIKGSILDNESRTIKLERTLNGSYEKAQSTESKRFIELMKLENIGLVTIMLDIQKNIFDYSQISNKTLTYENNKIDFDDISIEKNVNEIQEIIDDEKSKKNLKVKNVQDFISINKSEKTLCYLLLLNRFLTLATLENNVEICKNDIQIEHESLFEEKANYLLRLIIKIMEIDESNSGGLIIFKFKEESNDKPNYTIISSVGKTKIKNYFNSSLNNNLFSTKEFINGYKYMDGEVENQYDWSSITAYKREDSWYLQDGNEFNFDEAKIGNDNKINRFNFIRIAIWDDEKLKGEAVLVLFDNKQFNEGKTLIYQSKIRYILSVRNKIADFLEKNYNNDVYKSWIEKKNIADIIKFRYHKFKHGAGKHLRKLKDKLKEKDFSLFCYSKFIEADIWIGNKLSEYLTNDCKFQQSENTEDNSILKEHLEQLFKFLKDTEKHTTFKTSGIIDDKFTKIYNAKMSIDEISNIIYELYSNAIYKFNNVTDAKNAKFEIIVEEEKIITKSINGRIIDDNLIVDELYKSLGHKFPSSKYNFSGIGLFTINKLVEHYFNEKINIKIYKNKEDKIFEVAFRIK